MKRLGKITLKGASGASYRFSVYPWEADFEAGGALYIVTKRREKDGGRHSHRCLWAGQTSDLAACVADHRKSSSLQSREPNCVCVHSEATESERSKIESDLMLMYRPPCDEPVNSGERDATAASGVTSGAVEARS